MEIDKGIISTAMEKVSKEITDLTNEKMESEKTIGESISKLKELAEPQKALERDLNHLETITTATGENKPADLKKAQTRLDTVDQQIEDYKNTIETLQIRINDIDRLLKQEKAKEDILDYFYNENYRIKLSLKALFEGLNEDERRKLKKMIGNHRNYLSRPQMSPNAVWAVNRTMKAASEGGEYYQFL